MVDEVLIERGGFDNRRTRYSRPINACSIISSLMRTKEYSFDVSLFSFGSMVNGASIGNAIVE